MNTLQKQKDDSSLSVEKCCKAQPIYEIEYKKIDHRKPERLLTCEKHWNTTDENGRKYYQKGIAEKTHL